VVQKMGSDDKVIAILGYGCVLLAQCIKPKSKGRCMLTESAQFRL